MKLDPRHLEMLFAIVDRGGLTEGADMLGKSQPSLSRSLAMLEQRVGAALFEPGKRPLQPTELGQALAMEGRKVYLAGHESRAVLERFRQGRSGAVRMAGTPVFLDGVISNMVAGFQSQNPDVRIDQSYGYLADLLPKLEDGTLDLAIMVQTHLNVYPISTTTPTRFQGLWSYCLLHFNMDTIGVYTLVVSVLLVSVMKHPKKRYHFNNRIKRFTKKKISSYEFIYQFFHKNWIILSI